MKKILMAVLMTLFLFFLGIFLWSLWPSPIIENYYQIDFEQPLFKDANCNPGLLFDALSFKIGYPEFLTRSGITKIHIDLQKIWLRDVEPSSNCTYQVEMYLDFADSFISPQNRLLQTLSGDTGQSFQFEVKPNKNKNKINGDLWIYLIAESNQIPTVERLPVLVVPITVLARSSFGVSRNLASLISKAFFLVLFVVIVFLRKPE